MGKGATWRDFPKEKYPNFNISQLPNLIFEPLNFVIAFTHGWGINVESEIHKELSKVNEIYLYNIELGNTIVFHKGGSEDSFQISLSDIISSEVTSEKIWRGRKGILTLKTLLHGASMDARNCEGGVITIKFSDYRMVKNLHEILQGFIESLKLRKQTREITFSSSGSTKTLTICPFSACKQEGEEVIVSVFNENDGRQYLITNYRVVALALIPFYGGRLLDNTNHVQKWTPSQSLIHGDYQDVIAVNVKKHREEDIVGGINSRSSLWNLVQKEVDLSYNQSKHHASSIETESGRIVFMNDGKKVMVWENFKDPNSLVQQIKSARTLFQTPSTEIHSQLEEDPMKILKMRYAKGEISKEEFFEMKSILE